MPHDVFVFKEEIHILTSSWFTKVNVKDANILLVIYALNTFLFSVFISLANFGPIPTKNSLKRLQISWGSVIVNNNFIENFPLIVRFAYYLGYGFTNSFYIPLIFLKDIIVIIHFSLTNNTF